MLRFGTLTLVAVAVAASVATGAYAVDLPIATKSPPPAAPSATCGGIYAFFLTGCPLTWYGVAVYGTVDLGVTYQTHGSPFDPNFHTGASYLINKPSREALWSLGPNGLSQSNIGVKFNEGFVPGWAVVGQGELAFDPYSLRLANAPQALQNAIGVPQNAQEIPVDSSRWGWLAGQIYAGVSSPVYGTLTFGRQNSLLLDGVIAYDPMGASYAFSPIGFSGMTCGAGDTEECRFTTAIKYRANVGDFRLGVIGQVGTYAQYNPSDGAIEGDLGGDIRNLGPGIVSLDAVSAFAKDAVNISPVEPGQKFTPSGMPITFPTTTFLQATISNQTSFMALAKYTVSPLTLYAGFEWVQFAPPSDPQTLFRDDGFLFVQAAVGGTGNSGNGTGINNVAFSAGCGTGTGCTNKYFQVAWTGAKYAITQNLDVIGAYYHYNQQQYVNGVGICANTGAHAQCAGTEDMWSSVVDWRFLPKWDVYLGTFFSQVNGGLANGFLARNNLATTTGVRFRF